MKGLKDIREALKITIIILGHKKKETALHRVIKKITKITKDSIVEEVLPHNLIKEDFLLLELLVKLITAKTITVEILKIIKVKKD